MQKKKKTPCRSLYLSRIDMLPNLKHIWASLLTIILKFETNGVKHLSTAYPFNLFSGAGKFSYHFQFILKLSVVLSRHSQCWGECISCFLGNIDQLLHVLILI